MINGEEKLYMRDKAVLEKVIDDVKHYYIPVAGNNEIIDIEDIRILEPFTIEPVFTNPSKLLTEEETFAIIMEGDEERIAYHVQEGDNFYSICRDFRLDPALLWEANPSIDPGWLKAGDVLNLTASKPLLNVECRYQHVYREIIPAPINMVKDDTMVRDQAVVDDPGESGIKKVCVDITLWNGLIIEREVLIEDIIKLPKLRTMRRGTRRTPDDILLCDAFLTAGKGIIISRFGVRRWEEIHTGIDVGIEEKVDVYAYRDGTVTFAGYEPDIFGNLIIIDHGNGLETCYAHCIAPLVKQGALVKKGQVIARSTALQGNEEYCFDTACVHFEVRINKKPIDPLNFVKSRK